MMNMHTLLKILSIILAVVTVPSLVSVQARKLGTPQGSFTVDLIHRDSLSPSPNHNSSSMPRGHRKRWAFGSVSRGHQRIRLSSAYYGDEKDVIPTDILPNGADYVMKIAIGNPPVELTANADTGSDLIWVECAPCESCIGQQSPLFDPSKSSTYQPIPCSSKSCQPLDLPQSTPCGLSNQCEYSVGYGDGTTSNGILSMDTITFSSSNAAFPSSVFGCGYDQQGHIGPISDGIIGLGLGPSSLVSQLGPSIDHKFSYCLVPLASEATSKLKFGADVTSPGKVSTSYTIQGDSNYYHLTLDSISVGGSPVQVGSDIIIDSGTTLTYLGTSVYTGVRNALVGAVGLDTVPDPNQAYDLCYDTTQGPSFSPPDVVFHFQGADVVLKAENTFRVIQEGLTCLAMIPQDDGPHIFGNIAQVNYEVGYDLQAKLVSFAPTDCTQF